MKYSAAAKGKNEPMPPKMPLEIQDQLNRVREFAEERATQAANTVKQGTAGAARRARKVTKNAAESIEGARAQTGRAIGEANRIVTEHPIAAAAAAVAAGAVAAWLFPRSTRRVKKFAPVVAQAVVGAMRDAARTAKEALPDADDISSATASAGRAAEKASDIATKAAKSGMGKILDQAAVLLEKAGDGASRAATRARVAAKKQSGD